MFLEDVQDDIDRGGLTPTPPLMKQRRSELGVDNGAPVLVTILRTPRKEQNQEPNEFLGYVELFSDTGILLTNTNVLRIDEATAHGAPARRYNKTLPHGGKVFIPMHRIEYVQILSPDYPVPGR